MSVKRSRLEIIRNILEWASQSWGVEKTHIIFQSNLSDDLIEKYLNFIVDKKLIDVTVESDGRRLFRTNNRGREYIDKFRELENTLAF